MFDSDLVKFEPRLKEIEESQVFDDGVRHLVEHFWLGLITDIVELVKIPGSLHSKLVPNVLNLFHNVLNGSESLVSPTISTYEVLHRAVNVKMLGFLVWKGE